MDSTFGPRLEEIDRELLFSTLEVYLSNRYNIAIQLAKKAASSSTWTRVGAPVMSGYINKHSSNVEASRSVSISNIIEVNPGDEVAIFTVGLGLQGNVYAIKKHCMLRIESLNWRKYAD